MNEDRAVGESLAPAPQGEPAPARPGESLRRAATITAIVGMAFSILFFAGYVIVATTPGAEATDAETMAYYRSEIQSRLLFASLYLMPFAGIAFIWFVVALRMWISASSSREDALLSNIQLVSGILFVALFFGAAAAWAVVPASIQVGGPDVPQGDRELPQYGANLLFVFGMRMAAMFVFTTSSIGRSHHVLPAWFTWLGYALGIFLLLSVSLARLFAMVFPTWTLILSVLLFLRARRIPKDIRMPPRSGAGLLSPLGLGRAVDGPTVDPPQPGSV